MQVMSAIIMSDNVMKMDEICERSEQATENKNRLGGNFKFSGCGHSKLGVP